MKLLFIVWDGPLVSYLEGLFYPIFNEIKQVENIEFHIIQFTWGDPAKTTNLKELSNRQGFNYTCVNVVRKPHPVLGSFLTILKGRRIIRQYITDNNIDLILARSTMPAIMVNTIIRKFTNIKLIFDADGLPLEERIDFAGLSRRSFQYRILKRHENEILKQADAVITRSHKAIDIHLQTIGKKSVDKFFTVTNGRNAEFFKSDAQSRKTVRKQLGILPNEKVFVYCGSLGPQYGIDEMLGIFSLYSKQSQHAKLLVITSSPAYLDGKIPKDIQDQLIVLSLPYAEVPTFLNAADIAFAIRKPTKSMQGIAPIKLGEYMLMGLPCIASKGIGDTEYILKNAPDCFLFDHQHTESVEAAALWALSVHAQPDKIRNFALEHFSLQRSAADYLRAFNFLNGNTELPQ